GDRAVGEQRGAGEEEGEIGAGQAARVGVLPVDQGRARRGEDHVPRLEVAVLERRRRQGQRLQAPAQRGEGGRRERRREAPLEAAQRLSEQLLLALAAVAVGGDAGELDQDLDHGRRV